VWNDLANRCVRTVPLKPLIKTKLNEKQNHLSKSCFAVLGMSGFSLHQMYRTAHHQYKIYLWNILKLKARRPRSRCVSFWNLLHLGKLRTMRDWKQNHFKFKKLKTVTRVWTKCYWKRIFKMINLVTVHDSDSNYPKFVFFPQNNLETRTPAAQLIAPLFSNELKNGKTNKNECFEMWETARAAFVFFSFCVNGIAVCWINHNRAINKKDNDLCWDPFNKQKITIE